MLKKLKALINLFRPLNVFLTMLSVYLGAWISGNLTEWEFVFSGMIIAGLVCAGANAFNDYYDIEIDKINKPDRPLSSGLIPRYWGLFFGILFTLVSLYWSLLLDLDTFLFVFMVSVILWYYNWQGKKLVILGNVLVALSSALSFIFGGLLNGTISDSIVPAVFALLFHFSREIIKDVEDLNGDRKKGLSSIPLRYGIETAQMWITGTIFILIGFTFYPYLFNNYHWAYMVTALIGVDIFLMYIIFSLWQDAGIENAGRLSILLKWDMIIGILALSLR